MSQATNNTFCFPLFGHALGPWQVSADLLRTVPADVATDNNVCALPLRPFFGVVLPQLGFKLVQKPQLDHSVAWLAKPPVWLSCGCGCGFGFLA